MSKVLKAKVLKGRYEGQIIRVSNVSFDDRGQKNAACILSDMTRANIPAVDLEVIKDEPEPEIRKAKTASMPFISGSTSSRTMTHTKNMHRQKVESKPLPTSNKVTPFTCDSCSLEFNQEERKGRPGKITQCEACATETETLVEGKMIFSHKTGATIEIKKDGELIHEAPIFDPKNKT